VKKKHTKNTQKTPKNTPKKHPKKHQTTYLVRKVLCVSVELRTQRTLAGRVGDADKQFSLSVRDRLGFI
jgi:hypothetical protein